MDEPYWRSPYIDWLDDLPANHALLVCTLRPARQHAKVVAVVEALTLLRDYGARALLSGPAKAAGSAFWLVLPEINLSAAIALLPRLGYTTAVELAHPASRGETVKWHGARYLLSPCYQEDVDALREQAPDRREFLLRNAQGEVVPVRGYRGDGQIFSKRGLPVYDARMLVNLAGIRANEWLLDPFGGIGGVLLAARAAGARTASVDNDPVVSDGLGALAGLHVLADARRLPFADAAFHAIATEPPYDAHPDNPFAEHAVHSTISELARVLQPGSHLAIQCAGWQADGLRAAAAAHGLTTVLESAINRKGLDVFVFAWQKE